MPNASRAKRCGRWSANRRLAGGAVGTGPVKGGRSRQLWCIANCRYFFILRHIRQFATLVKLETIALAGLIPYALNARTHTESQVNQIAASILEFGWTVPIPVAGTP